MKDNLVTDDRKVFNRFPEKYLPTLAASSNVSVMERLLDPETVVLVDPSGRFLPEDVTLVVQAPKRDGFRKVIQNGFASYLRPHGHVPTDRALPWLMLRDFAVAGMTTRHGAYTGFPYPGTYLVALNDYGREVIREFLARFAAAPIAEGD